MIEIYRTEAGWLWRYTNKKGETEFSATKPYTKRSAVITAVEKYRSAFMVAAMVENI